MFLIVPSAFSQLTWEKTYGGSGTDYGYSVQQTTDGGYIVAGFTKHAGQSYADAYLIKTDASGETLWSRTYGGSGDDYAYSVQQTTDGGYILAGGTSSFGNYYQIYLIKTNASGDTLWTRNFGGPYIEYGYSVRQTSDGGYIISGINGYFGPNTQAYLIKTDASGNTLWSRTFGGSDIDAGQFAQQTADGGYLLAGYTASYGNGNYDAWLVKTNSSGDTLWTRTYGGTNVDEALNVQQTADRGYIFTGQTWSFGNSTGRVWLVKTDSLGDTTWTRVYGGAGGSFGASVQQTQDGGYLIAGVNDFYTASPKAYLIKTNASGDSLWSRLFGGSGDNEANWAQPTTDGGYIVTGYTTSFGDSAQVYLIKTDSDGNVGVEQGKKGFKGLRVQGYRLTPNPFVSYATIPGHEDERFSLYDVSGRKVGVFRGAQIGEGLSAGVYFLRPQAKEVKPIRIVKIR